MGTIRPVPTKVAKVTAFAVDVICPHCEELVENPNANGSLMWEVGEIIPGNTVDCHNCHLTFALPHNLEPMKFREESHELYAD